MMLLLTGIAFAGYGSWSAGAAFGGGEAGSESWSSAAPFLAGAYHARLLFLEGFVGASASALLARDDGETVLAAPLQAEAGLGLGTRTLGVGAFGSRGLGGPGGGLYAHLTLPGPRWAERIGAEARIFGYPSTDTGGVALLLRVEPGRGGRASHDREDGGEDLHHDAPYAEAASALNLTSP